MHALRDRSSAPGCLVEQGGGAASFKAWESLYLTQYQAPDASTRSQTITLPLCEDDSHADHKEFARASHK